MIYTALTNSLFSKGFPMFLNEKKKKNNKKENN